MSSEPRKVIKSIYDVIEVFPYCVEREKKKKIILISMMVLGSVNCYMIQQKGWVQ